MTSHESHVDAARLSTRELFNQGTNFSLWISSSLHTDNEYRNPNAFARTPEVVQKKPVIVLIGQRDDFFYLEAVYRGFHSNDSWAIFFDSSMSERLFWRSRSSSTPRSERTFL